MGKSIIQSKKECFVCKRQSSLENHHCLHGTANRKQADKYGLTVWLCSAHHRQVHDADRELDLELIKTAQRAFEELYGHYAWMKCFGKNYL